jgi:hypothetical protein
VWRDFEMDSIAADAITAAAVFGSKAVEDAGSRTGDTIAGGLRRFQIGGDQIKTPRTIRKR